MLTRRNLAAGLGLSLMAGQAWAGSTTPPNPLPLRSLQAPPSAPGLPAAPLAATDLPPAVYLDTALDQADRMTVEVLINGAGPFNFVVDSGADRSALAAPLAERLGLERGPDVMLHGVGGSAITPTAKVALMTAGESKLKNAQLPILAADRLGADGLLGVDILDGRSVVMDFKSHRLEVRRSSAFDSPFRTAREVSVLADARFGRLAIVNARVSGVRCVAFIDSGSGASIGNMALAEAIKLRVRRKPEPSMAVRMIGAAGEATLGEIRIVRSVELGEVRMSNLPLVMADLHIFDVWNLTGRPAVLLGVDVLRMFARVELDFGAERVKFRLGKGWSPPVFQA
jgi:predicted aspartyl protease